MGIKDLHASVVTDAAVGVASMVAAGVKNQAVAYPAAVAQSWAAAWKSQAVVRQAVVRQAAGERASVHRQQWVHGHWA